MSNTAILLIMDRSGSMSSCASEMERNIVKLAKEQEKASGTTTFDLVRFDDTPEYAIKGATPANFHPRLEPRGYTALYDAIVWGVAQFGKELRARPVQPDHVMVVVITDGDENASKAATAVVVGDTIAWHEGLGWDFSFLGANQDAVYAGQLIGFQAKKSMTFNTTKTQGMTTGLSQYIAQSRSGQDAAFDDDARSTAK